MFVKSLKENKWIDIDDENQPTYIDNVCKNFKKITIDTVSNSNVDKWHSDWFTYHINPLQQEIYAGTTSLTICIKLPTDLNIKSKLQIAKYTLRSKVNHAKNWISNQLNKIEALNDDQNSHWRGIKQLFESLTDHHKTATDVKMCNNKTCKKSENTKDNAKIFVNHFEHNVFNKECQVFMSLNNPWWIKTTPNHKGTQ